MEGVLLNLLWSQEELSVGDGIYERESLTLFPTHSSTRTIPVALDHLFYEWMHLLSRAIHSSLLRAGWEWHGLYEMGWNKPTLSLLKFFYNLPTYIRPRPLDLYHLPLWMLCWVGTYCYILLLLADRDEPQNTSNKLRQHYKEILGRYHTELKKHWWMDDGHLGEPGRALKTIDHIFVLMPLTVSCTDFK